MSRIDEADGPEEASLRVVGVEGVDGVVLRRDKHHVMKAATGNVDVGQIQRLRIDLPVHRIRKQFSECGRIDGGRGQKRFV